MMSSLHLAETLSNAICYHLHQYKKEKSQIDKAIFSMMEEMAEEIDAVVDRERLPRDVIPLILINLPIKALLRFKAVSKWWNTFISSPNFISKHQTHLAAIKQRSVDEGITLPSLMLTVSEFETGSVHPVLLSLNTETNTISTTHAVCEPLMMPVTSWHVILGPSVGVFCLISDAGDVTLWNPATREVRNVFHFNMDQSVEEFEVFGKEGYGFLCVCDDEGAADFRFVKFYSPPDDEAIQALEFETYCLSTNVWTTRLISNFFFYYIDPNSIELNGTLHWYTLFVSNHYEDEDDWVTLPVILTYDLSRISPTIGTIDMLPELHMEPRLDDFLLTKFDNQYLSFIIRPQFSEYTDVWVMHKYGVAESWVRQVRVGPVSSIGHFFLSGHWNNLGTFFLLDDNNEEMKWVINDTQQNFSTGIEGDMDIFEYAESVMPISGIQGRMQLAHEIHTF